MAKKLNVMQKRFCEFYIQKPIAGWAAVKAGYSKNGARVQGHRLLNDPLIKDYLDKLMAEYRQAVSLSTEQLLEEYKKIAFADLNEVYDKDGRPLPPDQWPESIKGVVQEMEERVVAGSDGERVIQRKVKLHAKQPALEALAKHLGFFEKDHQQAKPDVSLLTADEKKQLVFLLKKSRT